MSRKTKLILLATLIILIGLTLAVFNDTIRAKMFFFYPLTPASPSERGLVAYWPLDGNALDKSGNGRNGTVTGTTAYVAGKVGSAFDFSSTYIESPWPLTGASKGSISLWFNADTASGLTTIANSIMGNASAFGFYLNGSTLTADVVLTTKGRYTITSGISTGTWYNAVLTYDGTTIKMYLNGAFVGSQQDGFTSNTIVSFTSTTLGERITNYDFPFDGKIDDVRIYDRALSPDEIKQYYDATSAGHYLTGSPGRPNSSAPVNSTLTSGLVGHWTFDGPDTTSTTATDRSGSGNNGTLTNMTFSQAQTPGVFGQGLKFDGVDDYVDIPDADAFSFSDGASTDSPFSISGWVKLNGANNLFLLDKLDISTWGGNQEWAVYINSNGAPDFQLYDKSVPARMEIVGTAGDVSTDTWTYVAFTYSGSSLNTGMKIYVNGAQKSTTNNNNGSYAAMHNTVASVRMLADQSTYRYSGQIDDVRVYNRALSASEVQQLYNLGAKNKITANSGAATNNVLTGGLVGHWTFDGPDTTSTTATDRSGSGNNGTLTNMTFSQAQTPGVFGQGLKFDGVDDYVTMGDAASLDVGATDSVSVSFWMKLNVTNYPSGADPIRKRGGGGGALGYYFEIASQDGGNNDLKFSADDADATASVWINNGFDDLAWHHVVGILNRGDSKLHTYLDGVLREDNTTSQSTASVGTIANNSPFSVGASAATSAKYVNGLIDDVRIYNRALSASEVQQLYNLGAKNKITANSGAATNNVLTGGLSNLWTFNGQDTNLTYDNTTGTSLSTNLQSHLKLNGDATDASGNGNNGSFNGTTDVSGKIDQGRQFNGTSDYITSPGIGSFSTDNSFSVWFKTTDGDAGTNGVGAPFIGNNGGGWLGSFGLNSGSLAIFNYDGSNHTQTGGSGYNDGAWHNATLVRTTTPGTTYLGTCDAYLDGVEKITDYACNFRSTDTAWGWGTLGSTASNYFAGTLDDVRAYNRALTAVEVQQLYAFSGTMTDRAAGALNGILGQISRSNAPTPGVFGQALKFDGTDDYIDIRNASNVGLFSDNNSLSVWFKSTDSDTGGTDDIGAPFIGCASNTCWLGSFGLDGGKLTIHHYDGSSKKKQSTLTYSDGNWHNAVLVRTKGASNWLGTCDAYIDNVKVITAQNCDFTSSYSDWRWYEIGREGNGTTNRYFAGTLDDMRYYNRALSAGEVWQLYNLGR